MSWRKNGILCVWSQEKETHSEIWSIINAAAFLHVMEGNMKGSMYQDMI